MTQAQKTYLINRIKNELDPKYGFGEPAYNSILGYIYFEEVNGNIEVAIRQSLTKEMDEDIAVIYEAALKV